MNGGVGHPPSHSRTGPKMGRRIYQSYSLNGLISKTSPILCTPRAHLPPTVLLSPLHSRGDRTAFSILRRFVLVQLWWVVVDGLRRGASVFGNSDKRSCALLRCGVMAAKIRVVMKSFTSQSNKVKGLLPYTKKVGLPESRALFTVLRSPHIDKKSREQFSMHIKKQFVEQTAEMHELDKKLFWLKRLRIPGAQYEVQISFKTRLDMGSLKSLARS